VSHPGQPGALAAVPIPTLQAADGWRAVPVGSVDERFVALPSEGAADVVAVPAYIRAGYRSALPWCYARVTIVRLLLQAAWRLPSGWRILVYDAWRPLALQREIFDRYRAELRRSAPHWSEEALLEEVRRYVAPPSADPHGPSPHATGGAVDVGLGDDAGRDVDMGTAFDAFQPESATRHFEEQLEGGVALGSREMAWVRHRRLLFHALSSVGFANYPNEWWHFQYGCAQYPPIATVEELQHHLEL
jgi:zinc D-Ala-D-Ala dipeptidase